MTRILSSKGYHLKDREEEIIEKYEIYRDIIWVKKLNYFLLILSIFFYCKYLKINTTNLYRLIYSFFTKKINFVRVFKNFK